MRKIYLVGAIDEAAFLTFSEKLDEFELKPGKPVEVVLNSSGGSAVDALAFYSRIKASPLDINITVYGCCYSAAILVLAAGDERRMTRASWAMVHEDSGSVKHKTTSQFQAEAFQMRQFENQWNDLLALNSRISSGRWAQLHGNETYLTPEDCLRYGLIEEIV